MKVSIITATYNREATIERAIKSIRAQSHKDIQLIIIDGASADNTVELVKPYLNFGDVLVSEPDSGIYDALNKGLSHVSGELVAFMHSDDHYFDIDVVAGAVEAVQKNNANVVYGNAEFFSAEEPLQVRRCYRSSKLSLKNLSWGLMPAHPTMFIKSKVYSDVGNFRVDFVIAADYEFLCRLVLYNDLKPIYVNKPLVRMQLGGASTNGLRATIKINREVLRALRINGIYSNIFMVFTKYPTKILQWFMS